MFFVVERGSLDYKIAFCKWFFEDSKWFFGRNAQKLTYEGPMKVDCLTVNFALPNCILL